MLNRDVPIVWQAQRADDDFVARLLTQTALLLGLDISADRIAAIAELVTSWQLTKHMIKTGFLRILRDREMAERLRHGGTLLPADVYHFATLQDEVSRSETYRAARIADLDREGRR